MVSFPAAHLSRAGCTHAPAGRERSSRRSRGRRSQPRRDLYDFGKTRALVAASRARLRATKVDEDQSAPRSSRRARRVPHWSRANSCSSSPKRATKTPPASTRASALVQEGARPRGDRAPWRPTACSASSSASAPRASSRAHGSCSSRARRPLDARAEPISALARAARRRTRGARRRAALARRAARDADASRTRAAARECPVLSTSFSVASTRRAAGSGPASHLPRRALAAVRCGTRCVARSAEAADARATRCAFGWSTPSQPRQSWRARGRRGLRRAARRHRPAALTVCKHASGRETGYELGAMQFEQVVQAAGSLRRAETELVMARIARAEAVLRSRRRRRELARREQTVAARRITAHVDAGALPEQPLVQREQPVEMRLHRRVLRRARPAAARTTARSASSMRGRGSDAPRPPPRRNGAQASSTMCAQRPRRGHHGVPEASVSASTKPNVSQREPCRSRSTLESSFA